MVSSAPLFFRDVQFYIDVLVVIGSMVVQAVASLRTANDTANTTAASLKTTATATDFDKLRETAAAGAVAFAQAAQERAVAVYTSLVAHGERVVGTGVVEAAEVVNADIETTEEPKAVEAAQVEAAQADAKPAAKPRKKATRPAGEQPTAE